MTSEISLLHSSTSSENSRKIVRARVKISLRGGGFWLLGSLSNALPDTLPVKCQPPAFVPELDNVIRLEVIESMWRPLEKHIS